MSRKALYIKVKPNAYKNVWFVTWYWEATQDEILNGAWNRQNSRRFRNEKDARNFADSLNS